MGEGRLLTVVAGFVPSVRPSMLETFLWSWRDTPTTKGIRLYVHAQREPEDAFEAVYGPEITEATYAPEGGPVLPMRVAAMMAHPDVDVWIEPRRRHGVAARPDQLVASHRESPAAGSRGRVV